MAVSGMMSRVRLLEAVVGTIDVVDVIMRSWKEVVRNTVADEGPHHKQAALAITG